MKPSVPFRSIGGEIRSVGPPSTSLDVAGPPGGPFWVTKQLVNRSLESDYQTMARYEADGQALMFDTDFHREAVDRFVGKQPSRYNWDELTHGND